MPVLVYGDILYCPAAPSTLQLLNSSCRSALDFTTNNKFDTQHCSLYYRQWLDGLHYNQEETALSLFTYKALLSKLPNYFTSLLSLEFNNCSTQFRNDLTLNIPHAHTNAGTTAFRYYSPFKWNKLQAVFKLKAFIPLGTFKALLADVFQDIGNCFL